MCIGMCIGAKRKTHEMAFGVALLWLVLLPSPLQISPLVAKLHENSFCYQQLILAKLSVIVLLLNDYLPTQGTLLVVTDSYYGNESITIRRRQFQPHTAIIQREGKA